MTFNQSPYEIRTKDNHYFSTPLFESEEKDELDYLEDCKKVANQYGFNPDTLVISRTYMGSKS